MLSLEDLAALVTRCREVELAGFRVLGTREIGDDARCALFLAGASRAHGFRAGLLESCVPAASGFVDSASDSLPQELKAVFEAIREEDDDRAAVDAVVETFYPALRDAYAHLMVLADGPGDTDVRRTFRRCRDDVAGVLEEAAVLGVTVADGLRARQVRALLGEAGGPFGALGEEARDGVARPPRSGPGRTA